MQRLFGELRLVVLERGWLSSNNIVFDDGGVCTVVDTGYHSQAPQTVELVDHALQGRPLERIVNTHLHSDHCGGNAALQVRWQCAAGVPEPAIDAVRSWNEDLLSYRATGQQCDRFEATFALTVGTTIHLGPFDWQLIAAPGHDPDAVMLFQRDCRVLISADALWEHGLAIVFPELEQRPAFHEVEATLDTIAALDPVVVIPGHGAPFSQVREAVARSRTLLQRLRAAPQRHAAHAMRALVMFHMLDARSRRRDDLVSWMLKTPVFATIHDWTSPGSSAQALAEAALTELLDKGALRSDGAFVRVA